MICLSTIKNSTENDWTIINYLFCSVTKQSVALIYHQQEIMDIIALRMRRAAIRQLLRDRLDWMSQEEIDKLLDQINLLTELIELLEKKEN